MNIEIRRIEPDDLDGVIAMMREFAVYEDLEQYCDVTRERLSIAMFGKTAFVEGLVAASAAGFAAYAFFFPSFSSFRGQRGLYLEDLFIREQYRGTGLGEQMLRAIARSAAERGFERIDFLVLDWNATAIRFYKRLGAIMDTDERHFKFTDEAFARLAE